ncbi:hypothetical protein HY489_00800 [Candidatus Woesearchaeota archaeon]|nr:hypothetical protein [Candidatus Woesearchaeota archaeon]
MIDKGKLIEILREVDSQLSDQVTLIAIGGTALNLLDIKQGTYDVDLMIEHDDVVLKAEITAIIYKLGFETQIQDKGTVVMFDLPPDYAYKSLASEFNALFKNLKLLVLSPIDILITKLGRYAQKDKIDIENIVLRYRPMWEEIEQRFAIFLEKYHGNKKQLQKNFNTFKKQYLILIKPK